MSRNNTPNAVSTRPTISDEPLTLSFMLRKYEPVIKSPATSRANPIIRQIKVDMSIGFAISIIPIMIERVNANIIFRLYFDFNVFICIPPLIGIKAIPHRACAKDEKSDFSADCAKIL